jgi:hypothetical protein
VVFAGIATPSSPARTNPAATPGTVFVRLYGSLPHPGWGSLNPDHGWGSGLGVGFPVGGNSRLSLDVGYQRFAAGREDLSVVPTTLTLDFAPPTDGVSLHALLGGGVYSISSRPDAFTTLRGAFSYPPTGLSSRRAARWLGVNAGIGLLAPLSRSVRLDVNTRYHATVGSRPLDGDASGLSYLIAEVGLSSVIR